MGAAVLPSAAQFRRTPTPNDTLQSVRVLADDSAVFSIYAPKARTVTLAGDGDLIPYFGDNKPVVKSIIPFVESNYPVLSDRNHRAIAGLSMGGMETMETAFGNPDMFSYVWVLSSSFMPGQDPADESARLNVKANAGKMNRNFKQMVFTQGGPTDIAYKNCENTRKQLDADGLKYEYKENAQAGHSWTTWRADLYDLAQRIFK